MRIEQFVSITVAFILLFVFGTEHNTKSATPVSQIEDISKLITYDDASTIEQQMKQLGFVQSEEKEWIYISQSKTGAYEVVFHYAPKPIANNGSVRIRYNEDDNVYSQILSYLSTTSECIKKYEENGIVSSLWVSDQYRYQVKYYTDGYVKDSNTERKQEKFHIVIYTDEFYDCTI